MANRKVFHSVPTKDGWAVKSGGKTVSNHNTQANSEAAAIKQLHKSNNRIREERTYGADPTKTKG